MAAARTDDAFGTPHATIGIGPIRGGVALNIVPDRCALKVEARILPGQSPEDVAQRIEAVAVAAAVGGDGDRPGAIGVEVDRGAGYPPLGPSADGGAFAVWVAEMAGQGVGGAVDFGTEAGLYQRRFVVPVVVCGPGSVAQGHIADESLDAEQLAAAERFVAGLIRRLSSRS